MPVDPSTSLSKGFAFLEFADPGAAGAAVQHAHGYKLDKAHTLAVTPFDAVAAAAAVPDEYAPPPPREYTPSENLQAWMLDRRGRDQFAIRYGDETEVLWNDAARRAAEPVQARSFWSERFILWSPRGTYLATVHRQGVAVWGGPSFARLQRYAHPGVQRVDFSPGEKYLVTYSASEPSNPREKATLTLCVFDVRSGRKLRAFTGPLDEWAVGTSGGGGGPGWPLLKWAGGGRDAYCARLARGAISVYETPTMALLDKKSIKLDGVVDFAWSPSAPVLCAYQVEGGGGNVPARVVLIRAPDRTELRQKQLFSVSDVRLHWHPAGTYLAVEVSRFTKTRKSTYTHLELFTLGTAFDPPPDGSPPPPPAATPPTVPMEVLELAKTDAVVDFAWEPAGTRFGLLHVGADGPRPAFSLYDMCPPRTAAPGVVRVGTAPNQQANTLFWSPAGKFLVLAGLKALNGQLCFFSADEFEVLSAGEHFMAVDVAWDPTGRYVATSVTSVHQMENGYKVRGGWVGG
jgi:translation initiation factor 3 subunit B